VVPRAARVADAARVRRRIGAVPEVLHYVTSAPWLQQTLVDCIDKGYTHAEPRLLHLAKLVASHENACRHCYGTQRTVMRILGYREEELDRLSEALDLAELAPADRAILDFARELSRSNPRPDPHRLDELVGLGHTREAILEIAAIISLCCLINRVTTCLALPPDHDVESLPDRWWVKLVRGVVTPKLRGKRDPHPTEVKPSGPFSELIDALRGTHFAAGFDRALTGAFASATLSARAKGLIFAVVARALACERCEAGATRLLAQTGLTPATTACVLTNLTADELDPIEKAVVPFARETVHYRPAAIQDRTRQLAMLIGPERTVETIGTTALANAVVRLALLLQWKPSSSSASA
jgi:alkylhydroperoxidase family enzyme